MISVDYTFFFQFAIFLVLLVLLNKLLFKPMLDMFERREQSTTGNEADAKELNEKTDRIAEQYRSRLGETMGRAEELKNNQLKEGSAREVEILEDARQKSDQALGQMRQELADKRQEVLDELRSEADHYSRQIAQIILGRNLQ